MRSVLRGEGGIEDHFPEVIVGILKVACLPTPKGLLSRFHEVGPGVDGLALGGIHVALAADVVAQSVHSVGGHYVGQLGDLPEARRYSVGPEA